MEAQVQSGREGIAGYGSNTYKILDLGGEVIAGTILGIGTRKVRQALRGLQSKEDDPQERS